jgi:hypothetical protein
MTELRIEDSSVEYINVTVTTDTDPVDNTVSMCVVNAGEEPSNYVTATWNGTATQVASKYRTKARALVGTGTDIGALQAGTYEVYIKVEASPETVVIKADGVIKIY